MSTPDFQSFLHMLAKAAAGEASKKEVKRRPLTLLEKEALTANKAKLHALMKEVKAFCKGAEKRASAIRDELWDFIAQGQGYASNDAALADGMSYEIDGQSEDDEDADEDGEATPSLIIRQKVAPTPVESVPAKRNRFEVN